MNPYASGRGWVLHHGDCRDVLPALAVGSVDLVLTDPPYSVSVDGDAHFGTKGDRRELDFFDGDADWAAMTETVAEACAASLRVMGPAASAYWWCGHRQFGRLVSVFEGAGFNTRFLVWAKKCPPPPPPWAGWPSGAELCVYAYRPGRTWLLPPRATPYSNVIVADSFRFGQPGKLPHPTQKPVAILTPSIEASCPAEGLVCDLFAGSGSVGAACLMTGRRYVGVELKEEYAELIARRLARVEQETALFADVEKPPTQSQPPLFTDLSPPLDTGL